MPTNPVDRSTDEWIEQLLSAPRFAVYLRAANGDRGEALALYEWNCRLGAAFGHDLSHLEVGLRNAYDRALSDHLGLPGHWTSCGDQLFAPVLRSRGRAT